MAYTPIVLTKNPSNLNSAIPRNIYSIVDTYKVSNSLILFAYVQAKNSQDVYPRYTIYPATGDVVGQGFKQNVSNRIFSVQIEFNATADHGWQKVTEMLDALDTGFVTEKVALRTANLSYMGYSIDSNDPNESNEQQIFTSSCTFDFKVLL